MQSPIAIRETGVKVTDILESISQGLSYNQILQQHSALTIGDIMASAKLALEFMQQYITSENEISLDHVIEIKANHGRMINVSKVREEFPRAFMPWKTDEEAQLIEQYRKGAKITDIARMHQRNPGAIRSRLIKLGLIQTREK